MNKIESQVKKIFVIFISVSLIYTFSSISINYGIHFLLIKIIAVFSEHKYITITLLLIALFASAYLAFLSLRRYHYSRRMQTESAAAKGFFDFFAIPLLIFGSMCILFVVLCLFFIFPSIIIYWLLPPKFYTKAIIVAIWMINSILAIIAYKFIKHRLPSFGDKITYFGTSIGLPSGFFSTVIAI